MSGKTGGPALSPKICHWLFGRLNPKTVVLLWGYVNRSAVTHNINSGTMRQSIFYVIQHITIQSNKDFNSAKPIKIHQCQSGTPAAKQAIHKYSIANNSNKTQQCTKLIHLLCMTYIYKTLALWSHINTQQCTNQTCMIRTTLYYQALQSDAQSSILRDFYNTHHRVSTGI
jgi:hypothetical protein